MPLIDVEQQSTEWLQMRVGAVTASRMADVMAKLKRKDGEAAVRWNYKRELVCERLTGRAYDHYVTPEMLWGIENEPLAKAAYELETGLDIAPGGLAMHPTIKWLMASPDGLGLLGNDGAVECKCPTTTMHLEYIWAGVVPEEYQWQMLCQMACAERQWVDFVSFDPRLEKKYQLFIRRFERDNERIKQMEEEVVKFLAEIDEQIAKLKGAKLVDLDGSLVTKLKESLSDA